jgi:hypothetical protein
MGWPAHPIFGQGVAGATPTAGLGWSNHPHAQGGGPATPKGQKKKKKKKTKNGFWTFGGGRTTPKGSKPPPTTGMGWPKPPQALGGGPTTPKSLKPIFRFFFFFGLLGVAGPPLGPGVV